MTTERNATIESTLLTIEDHGCLTVWINLDYGGAGQGFGGNVLDEYDPALKRRVGHAFGSEFILRVLKTLGVGSWEKLRGTPCRVRAENNKVQAIGHYLKDDWFSPDALRQEFWPELVEGE